MSRSPLQRTRLEGLQDQAGRTLSAQIGRRWATASTALLSLRKG